jgi:hypothetical protein
MGKHSVRGATTVYAGIGRRAWTRGGRISEPQQCGVHARARQFDQPELAGRRSFLHGYPTGGSIDVNTSRLNRTWYHGLFVQDDWRISAG